MKPYYEQDGVTIYHGDAREIIGSIDVESIVSDPIWPGCEHIFPGVDAKRLLGEVLQSALAKRVVIQIGCMSDPRFLESVPARYPFFRVCWLEYACPSYSGRILNTGDVGYVFGEPPAPRKGAMVLPGKKMASKTSADDWRAIKQRRELRQGKERGGKPLVGHPTPRRIEHVQWLVKWFGGKSLVDPFCGSGTTLLAAKRNGITAVGIEIEERHCEEAASRLVQSVLEFSA